MTSSLFAPSIRPKLAGLAYSPAGAIFAVEGTVYPGAPSPPSFIVNDGPGGSEGNGYWCGFASGVVGGLADAQDGLFASPGVGYPALTVPMWPSVQTGRANLNIQLGNYATAYYRQNGTYEGLVILGSAWSQGAMVWCQTFFQDILPTSGTLHYLLPFVYRLYLFGDPMRAVGVAHGNDLAGQALPPKQDGQVTGGIADSLDYTTEQANLLAPDGKYLINSFVNEGDLYADAPEGGGAGTVEDLFFKIVMQPSFTDIIAVAELLGHPIGDVEAAKNAISFFAAGQNAAHFLYQDGMVAAINDALALGNSLPHSGC